jgi:acyl transferase domain-containing protein/NADPH:quinone reductase-like Zn-dependent oxidoreductase/surfactin synthase thioesterase subunit/acyl carrier protein
MNSENEVSKDELLLRKALTRIKTLTAKVGAFSEPIAIIGMGCRFPGGSTSPESFWNLLSNGIDGIIDIPPERFDINSYYDPEPGKPGKIITRKGAFIKNVDLFDADFFNISPIEAETMDPQQRLLLHITWEALENAAIPPHSLRETATGVFIGVSNNDYGSLLFDRSESTTSHTASGNALNALSGRLSYCLGLQGPSMIIDTACSSSLVSIHIACKSLQIGDCNLAIAGGANIMIAPENYIVLSSGQMLSPEGHCKTFDASADGYARGEGIGVLILKRLSDAKRDGDHILAVIKGSAVNQDGPSSGLTVPNGVAQVKLMRQALKHANLTPIDISYVEAHGTGTSLGDPIEVNAIGKVYGESREQDAPLLIGSIKSNIGHLESAAGVSSLFKVILAFKHKTIPGNLHYHKLNPKIDISSIPAKIVTELTPWNVKEGQKRVAGISGFGFTGTNAHIILEEAPSLEAIESKREERPSHLLILSARSKEALHELIKEYQVFLKTTEERLVDIVYTASIGRNHDLFRMAVIANDITDLRSKLDAGLYLEGEVDLDKRYKIDFNFLESGGYIIHEIRNKVIYIDIGPSTKWEELLNQISDNYIIGANIDWKKFESPFNRKKVLLPTYPFHYQRYWSELATPSKHALEVSNNRHPFLARRINTPGMKDIIYESTIDYSWPEFVSHHFIYDYPVIAGAGYISAILSIIQEVSETGRGIISDLDWLRPLVISKGQAYSLQVILHPTETLNDYRFEVISHHTSDAASSETEWLKHATGTLKFVDQYEKFSSYESLDTIRERLGTHYSAEYIYGEVPPKISLDLRPHFRWLEEVYVSSNELLAKMRLPESQIESKNYILYPGFIDSVFQSAFAYMLLSGNIDILSIPLHITEVWYDPKGGYPRWIHSKRGMGEEEIFDIVLLNESGAQVGAFKGFRARAVPKESLLRALSNTDDLLYEWVWEEHSFEGNHIPDSPGHWLLLGNGKISEKLINQLELKGGSGEIISHGNLPKSKKEFIELLQTKNANQPLTGILHLASAIPSGPLASDQLIGTESILYLTQAMISLHESLNIPLIIITHELTSYFASNNLANAPITGLYKTILLEHPELKIKHIDLNSVFEPEFLLQAIFADSEVQLVLNQKQYWVPRLLRTRNAKKARRELTRPLDDQFRLHIKEKGLLENLLLDHLNLKGSLDPLEVEVDMHFAGLNFRDVLNALGLYPGDPGPLGGDSAGIVTRVGKDVKDLKPGDAVFGITNGSLAKLAYTHRGLIALKPKNLNFAEACALPVVFLTVYYAFFKCTQIKKGDTILIHAGAGGVGLAAIQVAKLLGATIIATVGSDKKREFLKAQGVEHIFDSRSLSYGKDIEKLTQGQGVDVVLNSLSGEGFIETTVGICKKGACFLEIGKIDIWSKEKMKAHRPDMDYHIIALDNMMMNEPNSIQSMLKELIPLFENGSLKPLPITVFPIEEAIHAFEYLQGAKHIGKVVINLSSQPSVTQKIRQDATYLVTGGLGGLGQTLAKWLIENGARHLVLTGRREPEPSVLKNLQLNGTIIEYAKMDIGNEHEVTHLIDRLNQSDKPLKGIFHLAGILDDGMLMEQDWSRFEKVFGPKVYGSYYLHKYSKELDFFVMFSSISSTMGSPGQSNYAAANAFMDALCEYRKNRGLPAHSLSWGPWAEVGMAKDLVARHAKSGILGLNPKDGMRALEAALLSSQAHLTIANINWKNYLKQFIEPPAWLESFAERKSTKDNLLAQLETAEPSDRLQLLKSYVINTVSAVLDIPSSKKIDEKRGFFDMGLDSLMAVELKNRLQAGLGKTAILSSTTIFDHASIEKMTQYIGQLLKLENIQMRKREQAISVIQPDEPIAVIGMSCRFPGGANSPGAYWELLNKGGDAINEIPASRWVADSFYDPDPSVPGKMISKLGGFLDVDISLFDASFFKISPKEAEYLDPQQRLLLEVSYEAIKSSGIEPDSLDGSHTGVFIGICSHDYMDLLTATGDKLLINPYMATGNAASTATGRISFVFGLEGPNFAVDTACSSSLVAIDEACKNLRSGDASLALAGGVNLILSPDLSINFSKSGMLAHDGHCKTFDASADGYVRGEGCGIIVLKRLSDAKRDGNNILALIRASSVNQDGASSGLTVPNGEAQESLIQNALSKAKLKGADIDYLEAHGTGTALGDPIEFRAIGATYGKRDASKPLKLGSVKTNIGHLEGAAGIAGVIKVILALQHEMLPKHLHFTKLNPHIEKNFPVEIQTENSSWKRNERIRRGAVSSFGFSGTNAHVIIEEGPGRLPQELISPFKRQRYWAEAAIPSPGKRIDSLSTERSIMPLEALGNIMKKSEKEERKKYIDPYIHMLINEVANIPLGTLKFEVSMADYGFDSMMYGQIANRLVRDLGLDVNISDIQQLQNFKELTILIDRKYGEDKEGLKKDKFDSRDWKILKKSEKTDFYLFLCPPFGFGESAYHGWLKSLPENIEVHFVGFKFDTDWNKTMTSLADNINQIADKPFILYGHSMGGMIAYQLAAELQSKSFRQPSSLLISSSMNPRDFSKLKLTFPFNQLSPASSNDKCVQLLREANILPPVNMYLKTISFENIRGDIAAVSSYQYKETPLLNCPIIAFHAKSDVLITDESVIYDWKNFTKDFSFIKIDGTHLFFLYPPKVFFEELIKSIRKYS